jgi:hypothetical protein
MSGAIRPSTIFDFGKPTDNRKGCAVGVFHDSQCRKTGEAG